MIPADAPLIAVFMLVGALVMDMSYGDPRNRYHPTAWTGSLVARLVPIQTRLMSRRTWGAMIVVITCAATAIPAGVLLHVLYDIIMPIYPIPAAILCGIIGAVLLKSTLAVRGMERHALLVWRQLERDDIPAAGDRLAAIVKRKTGGMDRARICSGTVESIAENTVDGVTGSLFYMSILGPAGALMHRAVSTIDSMAGYRTPALIEVGQAGAICDTALNWIPARLTSILMAVAGAISGYSGAGALRAIRQDARRPDSVNSGYTMAAMAGALGITLEKPGIYSIGCGRAATAGDILAAIRIMKCTVWLFALIICLPLFWAGSVLYGILGAI